MERQSTARHVARSRQEASVLMSPALGGDQPRRRDERPVTEHSARVDVDAIERALSDPRDVCEHRHRAGGAELQEEGGRRVATARRHAPQPTPRLAQVGARPRTGEPIAHEAAQDVEVRHAA